MVQCLFLLSPSLNSESSLTTFAMVDIVEALSSKLLLRKDILADSRPFTKVASNIR